MTNKKHQSHSITINNLLQAANRTPNKSHMSRAVQQVKGCPDLTPRCGEFKLTKWPYLESWKAWREPEPHLAILFQSAKDACLPYEEAQNKNLPPVKLGHFTSRFSASALAMMVGIEARATRPPSE